MIKLFKYIVIIVSLIATIDGFSQEEKSFINDQESFGGTLFVEHCLKNGVNLVSPKTGFSLLHLASFEGRVDDALRLIENGVDVNLRTKEGETPLYAAIFMGHIENVDLLIKRGADANAVIAKRVGGFKTPPLQIAVNRGMIEIVKLLLAGGANINAAIWVYDQKYTSLSLAIQNNDTAMVKLLLAHGAKISGLKDIDGTLPPYLKYALSKADIEIINELDFAAQIIDTES